MVAVRSQALCLLDRVAHLGPAARAVAQGRENALRREGGGERHAFKLASQERGLTRVGVLEVF